MANYTPQEIEAFRRKDKLNARFSSLKAASINNEGKGKKPASIKKEAAEYYEYIMQDQTVPEPAKDTPAETKSNKGAETDTATPSNTQPDFGTLPKANLAQKKVLDIIFEKLGATTQQEKVTVVKSVLRWSFAVHDGSKVLPSKVGSVVPFLEWLKEMQ